MKYELVLVLKPLLPEDLKTKVLKKVEDYVESQKGKVVSKDVWGKKHLAYPIKKHEEGYYILYNIELTPDKIIDFQRELKLMGDILRYMTIKLD
ncbi:30S ribosomal protein S6 [Candidatus Dojkabacteria bacterium]|nr:30S ribosomal protein S6 [Candidatus Dojkabacteria bacterium]